MKRRISKFTVLVITFVLVVWSLIFYLKKVEDKIINYNCYQNNMQQLIILDQKLENFFLRVYQFMNYDNTTNTTNEMQEIFTFLTRSSIKQEFGENIHSDILKLQEAYQQKFDFIESFKSINSRLSSSVLYMNDLHTTIVTSDINSEKRKLISTLFFEIGRLTMDVNADTTNLEKGLKRSCHQVLNKNCKTLRMHVEQFVKDIKLLRLKLAENKSAMLSHTIQDIEDKLLIEYGQNLQKEKRVLYILFAFAFLVFFALLWSEMKMRTTTRKLKAFRYAVENSDNMIMMTDLNRKITYVNDEFEHVSGYSKEEIIGHNANILKSNLMSKEFYKELNRLLDNGEIWKGEMINYRKDGSLLYEKSSIVPMTVEGESIGFLSMKLDITNYIEQQQRLQLSSTVFENTKDGILILDQMGQIISANQALSNMSGYQEKELIGKTVSLLNPEIIINLDNIWRGRVLLKKLDKSTIPVWLSVTPVYHTSKMITLIAIYTDLSEVIRTQKQADFLHYHDRLTLLPNRANIERAMELKSKNACKDNFAIMIIRLDKLSFINDSLGYAVGDSLLVNFSKLIYEILSEDVLMGRWDGNKFILLLEMPQEDVVSLANSILKMINEPLFISGHRLKINTSIGIGLYSDTIQDVRTLIHCADIAMHSARDLGSNQYQFYSEDVFVNLQSRLNIENALQTALEKDEFILNYQPQYDIKTKKIVGVETLIRWHNKKLGWVSPIEFLYIAEENGMIVELGFYIFEEACKAYMRWKDMGIELETIAINVSSIQLKEENFLERIKTTIKEVGIPPTAIEIELTEGYIVEKSLRNLHILTTLRELGCKVAIDDFGTGYSSMSYLKELPIDVVKIDKSFIDEILTNRYDKTVSKVIISLAHSLDYKVIAEGIETLEQEKILEEFDCDIGQGYFFSKPLEEYKLIEFIKSQES